MANSNGQSQGQTNKNWFARHKIITGILILFVIGSIGNAMGGNKETSNKSGSTSNTNTVQENKKEVPKEIIKVSAVRLSEEYDANKVAADAKYKGKTLEISGLINSIGKDILDTPYVTLKGRELSLFGTQCMFSKTDEPRLATLSKGQKIILRGEVSGELIGNVLVRDCQIVE